jgi:putative transcriptional regulator
MTASLNPRHHPSCDTLLRYTAGRLSLGMELLIEAHLAFCLHCRHELQTYEAQAGLGLEDLPPEEMEVHCLENLLHKIDEHGPPSCIDVTIPLSDSPDPRWPEALHSYVGKKGEKIEWEKIQGYEVGRLSTPANIAIRFFSFAPGQEVRPEAQTMFLLLEGEIKTTRQHYHSGDVLRGESVYVVQARALTTTLCLCVVPEEQDSPSIFTRLFGWLRR